MNFLRKSRQQNGKQQKSFEFDNSMNLSYLLGIFKCRWLRRKFFTLNAPERIKNGMRHNEMKQNE